MKNILPNKELKKFSLGLSASKYTMKEMFSRICAIGTISALVLYCSMLSSAKEEEIENMENSIEERLKQSKVEILKESKPTSLEDKMDMESAKDRIQLLEDKIALLEARLPTQHIFPKIEFLGYQDRKRILITGGAGFVGSHLVDKLMLDGHEVFVADNFFTGQKRNIEHWMGHENFELLHHDIVNPLFLEVDEIYHLASPASPVHYMYNPVKTIKTNTVGTVNMLGLAKRTKARILIASTSEVYGDPEVHPQPESYWGHVNPIGPRACYDEGKRVAETLSYAYQKQSGLDVRVARIFNTYGPRMHANDGRVVSNFILQALQDQPITVYGDGDQTRSFQYVSDLVNGLTSLMASNYSQPVNVGNPDEHTVNHFAHIIRNMVGGESKIVHEAAVEDDPQRRRPDITRAKKVMNWEPTVSLDRGLEKTIEYFRNELNRHKHSERNAPVDLKEYQL